MKKVLFLGLTLVLCLLSTSCTGSGKGTPENGNGAEKVLKDTVMSDSVLSEMALAIERQVVLERVKCIYGLIKEETTYLGGNVENDWLDKAFCTKAWNKLLMAVRKKEFQTNSLFFEVNRWTMAYDTNLVRFDEFEVADCYIGPNNEKTAAVNFTVYDPDSLVYEDGQWKIDNFLHLKYMLNLRESMYQYLDHDLAYLI